MSRFQHIHTPEPQLSSRQWRPPEAFRYCERITSNHYENFPVASRFIPKDLRPHVCAIYAFARTADDYADEPGLTPAERVEALNDWEFQLHECYRGNASHPIFVALRETIRRFDLPSELFHGLLQAFRMDVVKHRYETFEELLDYCRFSANPVGRLILLLFNYRNESFMTLSDHICTALQLTNFWQDVSVDLNKDRVYLPLDDLSQFGVSEEDLFARRYTQEFSDLLAMEVRRTEDLFIQGVPLLEEVGRNLSFELRLTVVGGRRILEKIRRNNYNVLSQRPTLSFLDKFSIVAQSFLARLA